MAKREPKEGEYWKVVARGHAAMGFEEAIGKVEKVYSVVMYDLSFPFQNDKGNYTEPFWRHEIEFYKSKQKPKWRI